MRYLSMEHHKLAQKYLDEERCLEDSNLPDRVAALIRTWDRCKKENPVNIYDDWDLSDPIEKRFYDLTIELENNNLGEKVADIIETLEDIEREMGERNKQEEMERKKQRREERRRQREERERQGKERQNQKEEKSQNTMNNIEEVEATKADRLVSIMYQLLDLYEGDEDEYIILEEVENIQSLNPTEEETRQIYQFLNKAASKIRQKIEKNRNSKKRRFFKSFMKKPNQRDN